MRGIFGMGREPPIATLRLCKFARYRGRDGEHQAPRFARDRSGLRPESNKDSLSQTPSGWRLIENRAKLLLDVGFLQIDL
jgi:hypothetical protein